ncbi:hypothetical protein D1841_08160 [Neglecta sp. X4]|nr:hypothetical protein [Neglectibacter sp. 59]NBJ73282.1 hypothetical protein [Neglectibacter sp. X4]NCE81180.1 hypothetical protein [Neglectibacter sp. X58]
MFPTALKAPAIRRGKLAGKGSRPANSRFLEPAGCKAAAGTCAACSRVCGPGPFGKLRGKEKSPFPINLTQFFRQSNISF